MLQICDNIFMMIDVSIWFDFPHFGFFLKIYQINIEQLYMTISYRTLLFLFEINHLIMEYLINTDVQRAKETWIKIRY